jgi:glycosyltransferase involved in cell wall biosynthesis
MTIGIDAANIRRGGGVTHLVEILRALRPENYGIKSVVVWGAKHTLDAIDDRIWIDKRRVPTLEGGLAHRTFWQSVKLSKAAREAQCSVLFVPGGSYVGKFRPVVVMNQNLLPFEWQEIRRYGWSRMTIQMLLLRLIQSRSLKNANGQIFLTEYAQKSVLRLTGQMLGKSSIIPHGLSARFSRSPKPQRSINDYSGIKPYRILYISTIDQYKHQWNVVEGVSFLRSGGFPVVLDLVGPAYPPALERLNKIVKHVDSGRRWVNYHGFAPYNEIDKFYANADLGIWASTCETFGMILLEGMAAGLPMACSNRGPMPEIFGGTLGYFDPEIPQDIFRALRELIDSPRLRERSAEAAFHRAQSYSWNRCADETFSFLSSFKTV